MSQVQKLAVQQVAEASVVTGAEIRAAAELGYDINAMLAGGEDIAEVLREVRK